jgi:hypothetical protein
VGPQLGRPIGGVGVIGFGARGGSWLEGEALLRTGTGQDAMVAGMGVGASGGYRRGGGDGRGRAGGGRRESQRVIG